MPLFHCTITVFLFSLVSKFICFRQRILDRNELFEKARGEMLDEIMNLGEIPVKQWEDTLSSILWSKVADYVFENIFLTAAQSSQKG